MKELKDIELFKNHEDYWQVADNIRDIYLSEGSLLTLLDFERVLDELDTYVFAHWKEGELVEGPIYEKYFVTCTFMWPRQMMPDPRGAERLLPYGCKVSYEKSKIEVPVNIDRPEDFRDDGSRKGRLMPVKVWFVKIEMPQELIADIEQGSIEIAGEDIDLEDINQAYQQGLDDQSVTKDDQQGNQLDVTANQ